MIIEKNQRLTQVQNYLINLNICFIDDDEDDDDENSEGLFFFVLLEPLFEKSAYNRFHFIHNQSMR
jgi:hypothetical protein